MPAPDLDGLLAAAQARVSRAAGLLQRPRTASPEDFLTALREAEGYLEWLRDNLAASPSANRRLHAPAVALMREIRQLAALLDQAARLGRRWLERLQACGGYTADGALMPLSGRGRISFFG